MKPTPQKPAKATLAKRLDKNLDKRVLKSAKPQQPSLDEVALFRQSVGEVRTLSAPSKVILQAPPPLPVPRQGQRHHVQAAKVHASVGLLSDPLDASNPSALLDEVDSSYRATGVGRDVLRKLRRGHWRVQGHLDLHGLRTEEARTALGRFLQQAEQNAWNCVRVVHGKGLGSPGRIPILKNKVLHWFTLLPQVLAFVQAKPADGGSGAVVVLLRSKSQAQD